MIQSIYLINEAGETEAKLEMGNFKTEEALLGGFLSAIQMFSERMSGKSIDEMVMGEYRMVVAKAGSYFLVTIHDKDDKKALESNKRLLAVFESHISEGITEKLLDDLRAAASSSDSSTDRASDWASKML